MKASVVATDGCIGEAGLLSTQAMAWARRLGRFVRGCLRRGVMIVAVFALMLLAHAVLSHALVLMQQGLWPSQP